MFQATLDSVVCRAQFFWLQIVKKSKQKTNKNNKEQQPRESRDTQVVTKFISEHSIIDPLNSYISAIMLSSAKIMRFSQ